MTRVREDNVEDTQKQEAARKDVERAFRVLQARWSIVKGAARG